VGLPAFIHKCVQELQGIIPLMTMDLRWQELAAKWQAVKTSQSSIIKEITLMYKGYPYSSELSQQSIVYNRNFMRLVAMVRGVFGYTWFAEHLEVH
ncbi:hypothetical protein CROQUDRAFT_9528, partial [Cronartium quercuum f. sp. fusiforme G11]